jgi:hypothetical protein
VGRARPAIALVLDLLRLDLLGLYLLGLGFTQRRRAHGEQADASESYQHSGLETH